MAGFIGNEQKWEKFDKRWKEALGPQRTSLHTKELRFKKDRDRELLARLAVVPQDCELTPMFSHIRADEYADLVPDGTIFEKLFKGYVLCLFPMISEALCRFPDEKISLVFEEVVQYEPATRMVIQSFQNISTADGEPRVHSVHFVRKGATCRTESGDFLAYAMLQHIRDKSSVRARWTSSILQFDEDNPPVSSLSIGRWPGIS